MENINNTNNTTAPETEFDDNMEFEQFMEERLSDNAEGDSYIDERLKAMNKKLPSWNLEPPYNFIK